jgi:ribonuclease E
MVSPQAVEAAAVRKPQIGDTRPAPTVVAAAKPAPATGDGEAKPKSRNRRGGKRGGRNRRKSSDRTGDTSVVGTDAELIERRRGKERNGKAVGRYMMCVQVREEFTQVAMLEGRSLIEHYVSRPADDETQIHGNIYLGRVQNVLPGMEAAFVDIGTQKNAVLYRGDVQFDKDDVVEQGPDPRIEQVLKSRQMILCQVTKNPIAAKGGRLTQEVSLPGRFVVLIPDSR